NSFNFVRFVRCGCLFLGGAICLGGGAYLLPSGYAASSSCQYLLKAQMYHSSIPLPAMELMENLRSAMLMDVHLSETKRFYPLYIPTKSLQEAAAFLKSLPTDTAALDAYPLRHGLMINMLSLTRNEHEALMALWLRDEREVVVNLSLRHVMDGIYKVYLGGQFGQMVRAQTSFKPTTMEFRAAFEMLQDTIRYAERDWRRSISPAQLSDLMALRPEEMVQLSRPIDLKQTEVNQNIFKKLLMAYVLQAAEEFRLNTIYRPQKSEQILAQRDEILAYIQKWQEKFNDILVSAHH
ncbi:MAG: hypothetical protein J6Y94_04150, partial [Bacteriovoracaceae bacterium]|nr:hypothetical protein [Bacteriovoracaceae bacterium]